LNATARIIGVHPVDAPEPCHLCEVVFDGDAGDVDFGQFTQPLAGRDQSYWQVPWDERLLSSAETSRSYVFFFHYLDFSQPMQSPFGPLFLPKPSPRPERLSFVTYESP
jgi:hypothetical protein